MGGGKKVSAGREADWSRELTRSSVISAVCTCMCMCVYVYVYVYVQCCIFAAFSLCPPENPSVLRCCGLAGKIRVAYGLEKFCHRHFYKVYLSVLT